MHLGLEKLPQSVKKKLRVKCDLALLVHLILELLCVYYAIGKYNVQSQIALVLFVHIMR